MKKLLARAGLAAALSSQLAGCSGGQKTMTLRGQVQPPAAPQAVALTGATLLLTDLSGTQGATSTLLDASGSFAVTLRTDLLPATPTVLRLQFAHPTRKGVLLQRDVVVTRNRETAYEGNVTSLSTLAALAYEAQLRLNPGRVTTDPAGIETALLSAEGKDTLIATLETRYRSYLAQGGTAPAEDPNLAQDATELAYP